MTVKCLSKPVQEVLVDAYKRNPEIHTIDRLAESVSKSRRTIIRVLEDAGVDPQIKRRPRKRKPVIVDQLPLLGEPIFPTFLNAPAPRQNWFQRIVDKFVRGFAFR